MCDAVAGRAYQYGEQAVGVGAHGLTVGVNDTAVYGTLQDGESNPHLSKAYQSVPVAYCGLIGKSLWCLGRKRQCSHQSRYKKA